MDADDLSMPERLSYQVAELVRRPTLAAIFSAFDHIDSEGRVLKTITPPQGSQALREALLYSNPLAHSSVMFRRELLERGEATTQPGNLRRTTSCGSVCRNNSRSTLSPWFCSNYASIRLR